MRSLESWMKFILTFMITIGYFAVIGVIILSPAENKYHEVLNVLLGQLSTVFGIMMFHYFRKKGEK